MFFQPFVSVEQDNEATAAEEHEPAVEELLIDLEHEMDKIYPFTCPNRVRQLLSKIAFKVHKEKDPGKARQTPLKESDTSLFFSGQGDIAQRHLRQRRPVEEATDTDRGEIILDKT